MVAEARASTGTPSRIIAATLRAVACAAGVRRGSVFADRAMLGCFENVKNTSVTSSRSDRDRGSDPVSTGVALTSPVETSTDVVGPFGPVSIRSEISKSFVRASGPTTASRMRVGAPVPVVERVWSSGAP